MIKLALRRLAANPGFTTVALVTLALGIGVNTTAFTALNRLLLQSLPFHAPDSLVQLWATNPRYGNVPVSPADYFDYLAQNTVFTDVAAYNPGVRYSYAEPGHAPIEISGVNMTANFFPLLGVPPELGRTPNEEESKKMAFVTLISDSFWREHYAADPNVLGRTIRLNGRQSTIIGVMPPSIEDPVIFNGRPSIFYLDPVTHSRGVRTVGWEAVAARLKPNVTLAQAQEQMNVVAKRLAHDFPDTNKDRGVKVLPYPNNQLGDEGARLAWMTIALTGLVLLIACINLANLQLVRTTRRAQEIGIRRALGCSRTQIVVMLMTESVLLSTLGGALGIGVAIWSNAFVARYLSLALPLNLRVIGFTFLASLVTGALFGIAPALLATRVDIGVALRTRGRGATSDRSRHWLRQGLVVIELTLALTLLAAAGFFVTGIYRLTHRELGWDPTHKVIASLAFDQDHFRGKENQPRVLAFGDQTLEALRALPGVTAAAISSGSPSWGGNMVAYLVEGRPRPDKGQEPIAGYFTISPGWFDVFGVRIVQGREFNAGDRADSAPVAIVNQSMARKLWPGESAVGRRIAVINPGKPDTEVKWAEVVGVMTDFHGGSEFYNPEMNALRFVRPWTQDDNNSFGLVACVRTAGPPAPLKETVRKTMGILAPDLALNYLATIDEDLEASVSFFSFLRRILVQIAALGLLLSGVGIYGVVANLVSERTKEIGIRMALGAQARDVVWLFIRNSLVLAAAGAALGLGAAFALVTFLVRTLPALPGRDPWGIAGTALFLAAVAVFAGWLPARRTTKINPSLALRAD